MIECFNECVDYNKLWKILKEKGIPDSFPVSWETRMHVKKQQLEPDVEHLTGSKLEQVERDQGVGELLESHQGCQVFTLEVWKHFKKKPGQLYLSTTV